MVFCFWLLSLSVLFSRFVIAYSRTSILFNSWKMFHCANITYFDYLFISRYTFVLFPLLPIMHNAAMDIYVQVFVWTNIFISRVCVRRIGIAGSYCKSIFNLLRNCKTIFTQGLHPVTFWPAAYESSNFSISLPALVIIFVIIAILVGVKWYLTAILICISPIIIRDENYHKNMSIFSCIY